MPELSGISLGGLGDVFPTTGGTRVLRAGPYGELGNRGVTLEARSLDRELPFGDRMLTVATYEAILARKGFERPGGVIMLDAPDRSGKVVVNCPLTGVALTQKMAEVVDTDVAALQDVVDRKTPLGMTLQDWNTAIAELTRAFEKEGIYDAHIQVGGSSVGVFSSLTTALHKKQYPTTAERLYPLIRAHLIDERRYAYDTHQDLLARALDIVGYATGDLPEQPIAPCWQMMNVLGAERWSDVDLQITSETINRALERDPRTRNLAHGARAVDLWGRWSPVPVHRIFPELGKVQGILEHRPFCIELEYLPVERHRPDWWTLRTPADWR